MELRHLRYFVVTAEQESIAAAANILCIVQPALTRSIKTLEEEIGARLFERHTRGVRLTPAGKQFYTDACEILSKAAQASINALRAREGITGHLNIGISPQHVWLPLIRDLLDQFRIKHPHILLNLNMQQSGGQLAAIRSGELNAGFMFARPNDDRSLASLQIHKETFLLACPEKAYYAQNPPTKLSDISGEPYIGTPRQSSIHFNTFLEREYKRLNFKPKIVQMGNNFLVILGLVAAGMGYSVVPFVSQLSYPSGIKFHQIPDLDTSLNLELVWQVNDISPTLEHFLTMVKQATQSLIRTYAKS